MSHPLPDSPRVVVIGSSCAGKTTFSRALAERRSCTVVDLDDLFWGPGWTPRPQDEFFALAADAAAGEAWVVAGNYGIVRDILWSRATTIVWLNFSLPVVLWRGLRRTTARVVSREELFQGNRESFRRAFLSRESILWWIVSTFDRRRRAFEQLRASAQYPQLAWLEARTPREAALLLHALHEQGRESHLPGGATGA